MRFTTGGPRGPPVFLTLMKKAWKTIHPAEKH